MPYRVPSALLVLLPLTLAAAGAADAGQRQPAAAADGDARCLAL